MVFPPSEFYLVFRFFFFNGMCQLITFLVARRTFPRNTFVIVVPAASGFLGIAVTPAADFVSRVGHVVRWERGEAWSWRDAHSHRQAWQEAWGGHQVRKLLKGIVDFLFLRFISALSYLLLPFSGVQTPIVSHQTP